MSTTVDYLLLRHSQSIYFEPNSIPQLPIKASKGFCEAIGKMVRTLGRFLGKLVATNFNPKNSMAVSKSPYSHISIKGLY